jgi:hypothetical protein
MRQSLDGLLRDESLDCALSFFIKSGILIVASDNHHTFTFFSADKMEIEMRAVIFYHCKQGKGGKESHYKLFEVCGKDSYSLGAVKYSVRGLKAQRTDLHDEVRPGRSLINIYAEIARLLNNESFGSNRCLARQLAAANEIVKRNLQEVLEFHKFHLKWAPNVLSAQP